MECNRPGLADVAEPGSPSVGRRWTRPKATARQATQGYPEQKAPEQGAGRWRGGCSAGVESAPALLSRSRYDFPPPGCKREMRSCVEHPARAVAGDRVDDRQQRQKRTEPRDRQDSTINEFHPAARCWSRLLKRVL